MVLNSISATIRTPPTLISARHEGEIFVVPNLLFERFGNSGYEAVVAHKPLANTQTF